MALYRLRGVTDNQQPYVCTNPNFETIIKHKDRAFVLGIEIPSELQGDIYEQIEKDKGVELESKQDKIKKRGSSRSVINPQSAQNRNPSETRPTMASADDVDNFPLGQKASKTQTIQVQKVARQLNSSIQHIEEAVHKISERVIQQNEYIIQTTKQITQEYLNSYKEEFQERINNEKHF